MYMYLICPEEGEAKATWGVAPRKPPDHVHRSKAGGPGSELIFRVTLPTSKMTL